MEIIRCTPSDSTRWDQYVMQCESAGFYHRFAWKEINERCFGHPTFYLAAADRGELRGVFPIVFLRSLFFGKILCSLPFVNFGGPCADDPETMGALLEEATSILHETRADYLEVRSPSRFETPVPASEHKVSMAIELSPDADTLWKAFSSKHRNNVRVASRQGFTATGGGVELLDVFYEILSESWRSLGTPLYAKSYFETIAEKLGDSISIFLVMHNGRPVGTTFNGLHGRTVEGMWAGTVADYRRSDANYVLYWEMIKHYCESGFARFHLGRSTAGSGAEAFKKKWLADGVQLYWHYVLGQTKELPQLNTRNPRYRLAIEAWRRTPLAVTRRLGPIIARGIP